MQPLHPRGHEKSLHLMSIYTIIGKMQIVTYLKLEIDRSDELLQADLLV